MARTSLRAVTITVKTTNLTPYNGSVICKEEGQFYVWFDGIKSNSRRARDIAHAKELIDSHVKVSHKEPKGPFGGYIKNPPSYCNCIIQDKEGLWVDVISCASTCKQSDCPAYIMLIEGARDRIRLLGTEKLPAHCPYCQSPLKIRKDIETTYFCGTIGNRLNQTYERACKPKTNRKTRRYQNVSIF